MEISSSNDAELLRFIRNVAPGSGGVAVDHPSDWAPQDFGSTCTLPGWAIRMHHEVYDFATITREFTMRRKWLIQLLSTAIAVGMTPVHAAAPGTWTFDRSTFDAAVDPCTDFYQHVCGAFSKPANIPADRTSASWARDAAVSANDRDLKQLLMGDDVIDDPEVMRLRTFFSSCMTQDAVQAKAANQALAPWLEQINQISSREQLLSVWLSLQDHGVNAFFSYTADPDPTEKSRYRGSILQGNLGQRRAAYSEPGRSADKTRELYRAHIARMFELTGMNAAQARHDANATFRVEAMLAKASMPYFDQFDPAIGEHPLHLSDLNTLAPHLPWNRYIKLVGQANTRALNVASPNYLHTVDSLIADMPIDALRAYLRWQFLSAFATALPVPLTEEQHRFESPSLPRVPRFQVCRLETIKNLGLELSRQFSQRYVGSKTRHEAQQVAENVRDEVVRSAGELAWLSPSARASTVQRLRLLDIKVGYPDSWPASGKFPLSRHAFLANVMQAQTYEQHRIWARAQGERSRSSWEGMVYPNEAAGMAAARLVIPNGFPDQSTNSIILTAASLQRPLFDADAPLAVRYGTFGFLVGHELGHVLDNHDFDAFGEPKETWTSADVEAHDKQNTCMIDQADQYVAYDDVHLNGKKTADENFGDFSGIFHAYLAMAHELGAARLSEKGDDGLTPAQRFFIAYAQQWCGAERPANVPDSVRDDGHAPPRYRTNAPLANMPAFAHAFSCPAGAPMVRPASTRCSFWSLAFPER
jgi:endothelin-converting enzyme/putative endopeptidase